MGHEQVPRSARGIVGSLHAVVRQFLAVVSRVVAIILRAPSVGSCVTSTREAVAIVGVFAHEGRQVCVVVACVCNQVPVIGVGVTLVGSHQNRLGCRYPRVQCGLAEV